MSLLTGSANYIKYVLSAFNFVFMLTGIVLIAVGVGVKAVFYEYKTFLEDKFFSVPTFLIVIGSFIIVFAFFGCWGTLKENYCLILTFSFLLAFICILELAAGISGYVLRSDAEGLIKHTLTDTMENYNAIHVNGVTRLWDDVQRSFTCCGIENFTDWKPYFSNNLPLSCCKIPYGIVGNFSCTVVNEDTNRHVLGCLTEFSSFIADHAISLGAAGIAIAVMQFFGVIFACYIAREIKIRNGITGFMG